MNVLRYLTYTYGITWGLWVIVILGTQFWGWEKGHPIAMICYVLGVFGPVLASIVVKKSQSSKDVFKEFLRSIVQVKHPIKYYVLAIGAPMCLAYFNVLMGGAEITQPFYMGVILIIPMIVGGGLEEIGWRGFMQAELEKKYSVAKSTSLVAIAWAIWHIPLWFIPFTNQANWSYVWYGVTIVMFAFMLASVYRVTKSIFLCIMCHASINAFWEVCMTNNKILPLLPGLVVVVGLCILISKKKQIRKEQH
ncbi:MAG: CPBP family intramembrane glutamic endopeptidase [Cellulosilyticaceae bacterium]